MALHTDDGGILEALAAGLGNDNVANLVAAVLQTELVGDIDHPRDLFMGVHVSASVNLRECVCVH